MPIASQLVEHWRKLKNAVHPDDEAVFRESPHSFNLDWPPPAYIGDVDNAPFVLLMMNGGYDSLKTPAEFPNNAAVERYIDLLHNPRPVQPMTISPYYDSGNYGQHIASGRLALVNAIAYRSGKLSQERQNSRLAENLPSTQVHRKWLRDELIPQALSGDRTIIAHRNGKWLLRSGEFQSANIVFTKNGASAYLPRHVIDLLERGTVAKDTRGNPATSELTRN